jgi:DNA-binding NarL/FixJ family response regulator
MTETRQRRPHAQEAQILELIAQGLNNTAIAERLYCGIQAVRQVRKAHGLPPAPRSTWRRTHPKEEEIQTLLRAGLSNNAIRLRTGADLRTIADRRAAAGIPRKSGGGVKGRRHPREAAILSALRAGGTNNGIAQQLGVDKSAVARVRRTHGIPEALDHKRAQRPSIDQVWRANVKELPGGHLEWTGQRNNGGRSPVLRYLGSYYSPAAIAFRMRTGRDAQGQVKAECDVPQCVAPTCVEDEPGRQSLRLTLRRLQGMPDPPTGTCPNGHELAADGRLDAKLTHYCEGCKRQKKQARTTG